MDFWKRLFSGGGLPPADRGPVISRPSPPAHPAPVADRRALFLRLVSEILDTPPDQLELDASLEGRYGCADLDVFECVQAAEEAWGVQLMPNPMVAADFEYLQRRLTTLQAIINDAERRASSLR